MKNCINCELLIDNKCCGRNDIYGKEIKTPIENCEEWEEKFGDLQEKNGALEATIQKMIENTND